MKQNQDGSEDLLENRRKRLIFRSWHRGTKEMDLILGSFADAYIRRFTESELDQYERILGHSDPDLYSWITGASEPPANVVDDMLQKIIGHRPPLP
ncbi:MAG: succinate dehydrogenase assembly factor 2 [Alphaproteobacteria bacterium]|nr:succinate dehydrogenase assembly factor 2 [Alphaproteobacteria bacterium]MCB9973996.1 succinate dehydrogenase assembly factor 2 [Rhodospirillales bacterium]